MPVRTHRRGSPQAGFTMVELVVVIAIILIISAMTWMQIQGSLHKAKSDTAMQTVLAQMRQVHEAAVDQRKIYRLTFNAPGTIQLDRMDLGAGGVLVPVFQSTTLLPIEISFLVVNGHPAVGPDNLGTGANPIDFGVDYGGGMNQVYFQPDGSARDNVSRLTNGVVYMGQPNDLTSVRAVSLLGATGRTKPWIISNGAWVQP